MLKFKKGYNLKIVAVIVSISLLFTTSLYAYPESRDTLRLPGELDDTFARMGEAFKAIRGVTTFEGFKKAYGAKVLSPEKAEAYLKDKRTGDMVLVWHGEPPEPGTEFIPKASIEPSQIQDGTIDIYRLGKSCVSCVFLVPY